MHHYIRQSISDIRKRKKRTALDFSMTMRLSKIHRSSWKIDLVADDLRKGSPYLNQGLFK